MRFIRDWVFNYRRGKWCRDEGQFSPLRKIWRAQKKGKIITVIIQARGRIIAICLICYLIILLAHQAAQANIDSPQPNTSNLPPAKVHALPSFLATWQKNNQGDYFNKIKSTPLGYLVWTKFPLKVYVDSIAPENTAANKRFQQWTACARQAIAEWNVYLPLKEVSEINTADILILRSQPARTAKLNSVTGLYDIPRAVTAQTNYEFYLAAEPEANTRSGRSTIAIPRRSLIAMRMKVQVSPNFTGVALLATIRHELGHALGIWGHSPETGDALYFSQVSNPPSISVRDINTLKKIYQQPTRLGWRI